MCNFAKTRAVVKSMVAQNQTTSQCWRRRVCTSCWRRVGGSCSADFAHRSSSHVRRFRRRPAANARSRLLDRYTPRVCNVRTAQHGIAVSGSLIIRVLRFETSPGFVGSAANLTCFGDLLRYLGDCCCSVGTTTNAFCLCEWSKSKSKSKERSRACDVRNVRAVLRRHISCRGVANSPVGWLVRQKVAAFFFF